MGIKKVKYVEVAEKKRYEKLKDLGMTKVDCKNELVAVRNGVYVFFEKTYAMVVKK